MKLEAVDKIQINQRKASVFGIGVNDADYKTTLYEYKYIDGERKQNVKWRCPFYSKWKGMLSRAYSRKTKGRSPTYEGVSVCDEWLTFSKFKSWMEKQDWEGKDLDKDLLVSGNKIYSPDTCIFLGRDVHNFINERVSGKYLHGVSYRKVDRTFEASIFFKGVDLYLGTFKTEDAAHRAWLINKIKYAKILAAEQSDSRIADALITRYISRLSAY